MWKDYLDIYKLNNKIVITKELMGNNKKLRLKSKLSLV